MFSLSEFNLIYLSLSPNNHEPSILTMRRDARKKENNKENVQLTKKRNHAVQEKKQVGAALVRGTWETGLELVQGYSLQCHLW